MNKIDEDVIRRLHEVSLLYNSTDDYDYILWYTFISRDSMLYFFFRISLLAGIVTRGPSIRFLVTGPGLTAESLS